MVKKASEPKRKEVSFGGGRYEYHVPRAIAPDTKVISFFITFEEALELSIALQAGLLDLNEYKRVGLGLKRGLCLAVYMDRPESPGSRINVLKTTLREREKK